VASILDCVVQPVLVVDPSGLIRFANPSALAALGYDQACDLLGKPSHDTIHHKRPDGTAFPVSRHVTASQVQIAGCQIVTGQVQRNAV
jgi:PAS domain-containing protein